MSDQQPQPGVRRPRQGRRLLGGALTIAVTSVALVAFGAVPAFARPTLVNPPVPTGGITAGPAAGSDTITVSGTWSWAVGTGVSEIAASSGAPCGNRYGVGWAMVWNDPNDPGYKLSYDGHSIYVGSTATSDDSVHYDTAAPCGTYSATAVTGTWTDSHTYTGGASSIPSSICVVDYVLRYPPTGHPHAYVATDNRRNSFDHAVKTGTVSSWAQAPNCFDPTTLKASPTIVTTATNAQVGSAITDTAVLSGTSQDITASAGDEDGDANGGISLSNAGGTVTFSLYGPSDTGCSSTPIFTSSPVAVSGNGSYGPVSFTPTQGAGTYRWIATYSGDTNNSGATEKCGASGEVSTVSSAPPTSPSQSTSPAASVTTAAAVTPTAVAGATSVHTGEPWAGSQPYVLAIVLFGLSLMGLGFYERRRALARRPATSSRTPHE